MTTPTRRDQTRGRPSRVMDLAPSTGPAAPRRSAATTLLPASSAEAAVTSAGSISYDLVLVGGVPGAGKSTAIARACDDLEHGPERHVVALDPEHVTWWLRRRLTVRVPYRAYRWVVHLVHLLRVLAHLLAGPRAGRRLVVHDPGTRRGRRSLYLSLAHLAGWRPVLVYVDVDRRAAQDGQQRRGRVVRSFDDHWSTWERLRPALATAAQQRSVAVVRSDPDRPAQQDPVLLVERSEAAAVLRRLCAVAPACSACSAAQPAQPAPSERRGGPRVGTQKAASASTATAASASS